MLKIKGENAIIVHDKQRVHRKVQRHKMEF